MAKKTLYIIIRNQTPEGYAAEVGLSKPRRPSKKDPYPASKDIVSRTLASDDLGDLFEAIGFSLEGHI